MNSFVLEVSALVASDRLTHIVNRMLLLCYTIEGQMCASKVPKLRGLEYEHKLRRLVYDMHNSACFKRTKTDYHHCGTNSVPVMSIAQLKSKQQHRHYQ